MNKKPDINISVPVAMNIIFAINMVSSGIGAIPIKYFG